MTNRLIGLAAVVAGLALLTAGLWFHGLTGWSTPRPGFMIGGVLAGAGLAEVLAPGSTGMLGEASPGPAGRWVGLACVGAGAVVGVGLWLAY